MARQHTVTLASAQVWGEVIAAWHAVAFAGDFGDSGSLKFEREQSMHTNLSICARWVMRQIF
jgi:hypothetical protein